MLALLGGTLLWCGRGGMEAPPGDPSPGAKAAPTDQLPDAADVTAADGDAARGARSSALATAGAPRRGAAEWRDLERLDPLRRWEPAGTLGVLVLRENEPVADAHVRVFAEGAWNGSAAEAAVDPPWAHARTGDDGRASFTGAMTGEYAVRVDDGGDHLIGGIDTRSIPTRTLVLAFGSGAVEGRVCDEAGAPLAGIVVRVNIVGTVVTATATTRTDRAGAYRIGGLCGGRIHVRADEAPGFGGDKRTISLSPGERAFVTFGNAGPVASWRGRILDAAGAVVPGERTLTAVDDAHWDERRIRVACDGTFDAVLLPGRWRLGDDDGLFHGPPAVTLDVPPEGIVHDLVVAKVRILVHVGVESGGDATAHAGSEQWLLWGRGASRAEGPFRDVAGVYLQWFVAGAGRYDLRTLGNVRLLAADPNSLAIDVLDGQRVVHCSVSVR